MKNAIALASLVASLALVSPAAGAPENQDVVGTSEPSEGLAGEPMDTRPAELLHTNAYLVALTVVYEATNQSQLGQELVARVVENRARKLGTDYYERVVFARAQFCAWTEPLKRGFSRCQIEQDSDPACFDQLAFARLCSYSQAGCAEKWLDILAMSWAVTATDAPEPRGWEGAFYFDNPKFWPETNGIPPWAPGKEFLGCEDSHCFWK